LEPVVACCRDGEFSGCFEVRQDYAKTGVDGIGRRG